jgi:hypothetical protein
MVVAVLVLGGFVLLIFVLPMWLVTRRGRHVVGSIADDIDYDQPYSGLGFFATRAQMGDTGHNTRKNW